MDAENRRNLDKYLRNIQVMGRLALLVDDIETLRKHALENEGANGQPIVTEVMEVKIGEFVLITSVSEVSAEIALHIKKSSSHSHTYISAFTNGYFHYGSPASDYVKGGDEVTECLLAPEWEEIYKGKALDILGRL